MCIRNGEWVIISRLDTKGKLKFLRSIRFRIMMLLFIMGIFSALIVDRVIVESYEDRAVTQRATLIRNQCDIMASQLISMGYMDNPDNDVIDSEFGMLTNIYGGRILVVNRDFRIIRDTYTIDSGRFLVSQEVVDCFGGLESSEYDKQNQYLEMTIKISDADPQWPVDGVMLISVSTAEINASKEILQSRGSLILAITILLVLVLGFWLSGVLVHPFERITSSIEELTDGYLEDGINVPDYLETELISNAFNRMLSRLRTVDESRQEFVSNVSHELKTPLASMKVLADSLNMQPDVPAEQYREFMQDISQEIDRENQIITDLLALVKMDKKADTLHIEEISINDQLAAMVRRLQPIADQAGVELILDSFRPVRAEVDATKLNLAISNIVENAIKYNKPEDGWVRISLNADRKYFYISIADSGIGIPEDAIDHIFERFYRVDKSHSREIGGTGLGLAITRSAIVMHHGAIRVASKPGEGSTFSIRIPLKFIA